MEGNEMNQDLRTKIDKLENETVKKFHGPFDWIEFVLIFVSLYFLGKALK